MSYVGNTPADKFLTLEKQSFSVSATTGYTLSHSVSSPQDIALFINNVRQNPNSSYSVSNTALVLSEATSSDDSMYCVFLGKAIGTVGPASNSVTTSMMASGVLNVNAPSFEAQGSSNQTGISSATLTKVNFGTEIYDTDGKFADSKFTPTVAGTYFIYSSVLLTGTEDHITQFYIAIYKNGSQVIFTFMQNGNSNISKMPLNISSAISLDADDFVEIYIRGISDNSSTFSVENGTGRSRFGAYKLGV
jgi:hypothetical protein